MDPLALTRLCLLAHRWACSKGDHMTSGNLRRQVWARLAAVVGLGLHAGVAAGQDFNGDGFTDLAIGTPNEDVGAAVDAGAVTIIWGAGPGLGLQVIAAFPPVVITQATFGFEVPEAGDLFGWSLAWGDFNGDGFDDLAVGAPGEDLPTGTVDAGLVLVYYGSPGGLVPMAPPYFSQGPGGLPDPDETGDNLGWSLAAGDFNADGFDDLAIGVPMEDVTFADQGMVHQCFGSPGGLMPVGPGISTFIQPMLGDPAEATDEFGRTLAAGQFDGFPGDDLAIGVPSEDFAGDGDCGMVMVVYSTPGFGLDPGAPTAPEIWTQDSPGVPQATNPSDGFGWSLAAGDFDGNGSDDLAIGVPFENLGANSDAGAVHVIYSSGLVGVGLDAFGPVPSELWHQNIAGIPEVNEPFDWFGYSLAAGDFNGDGFADLAIGSPNEDVGAITDAGYVTVIYGAGPGFGLDAFGPIPAQPWHQNRPGVFNTNEASDRFGWSLTVGDYDGNGSFDLVVSIPFEDLGVNADCGMVVSIYGSVGVGLDGLGPVPSELWHQNIAGIPDVNEPGDAFGRSLDQDD